MATAKIEVANSSHKVHDDDDDNDDNVTSVFAVEFNVEKGTSSSS